LPASRRADCGGVGSDGLRDQRHGTRGRARAEDRRRTGARKDVGRDRPRRCGGGLRQEERQVSGAKGSVGSVLRRPLDGADPELDLGTADRGGGVALVKTGVARLAARCMAKRNARERCQEEQRHEQPRGPASSGKGRTELAGTLSKVAQAQVDHKTRTMRVTEALRLRNSAVHSCRRAFRVR
jgi:hypothetical protein